MQRWIAAGLVVMVLAGGGLVAAYRIHKQNRPYPVWVPLQIRSTTSAAAREDMVRELKDKLSRQELLVVISKDVGLTKKWHLASDEAGGLELGKRLFVEVGEADTPLGKVPSINVGIRGNTREKEVSMEVVMRLMDDVWKILGIEPPPRKGR